MIGPTWIQLKVLRLIEASAIPPTHREICAAIGSRNPAAAHGHLERLAKKGYIIREPAKARAIVLTEAGRQLLEQTRDIEPLAITGSAD